MNYENIIKQFNIENIEYKKEIDNLFSNNLLNDKNDKEIKMGKLPLVYSLYERNILNANIYIHKSTINHFLKKHKYIEKEDILNLYEQIVNPLIIFNGNEQNTILSILERKSKENYNFQTPIYLNYNNGKAFINAIGSLYQQDKLMDFITKEIIKHNLIAYNKKIEPYIQSIGLLLPVAENKFSIYDDTISYTLNNVKNYNDILYYKFITNHKYFKPEFKATLNEIKIVLNQLNLDINKIFNLKTMLPNTNYDEYSDVINLINNALIENKINEINFKKEELLKIKKAQNIKENYSSFV